MVKKYTDQEILDLPMEDNDADAKTIGDYFHHVAFQVWVQGEGFDGKRPFGNSGWRRAVEKAMIKARAIEASFDEDGHIKTCDSAAALKLIEKALKSRLQE